MMRYPIILVTIISSQLSFAQKSNTDDCRLAMDVPDRMIAISSNDKEVIFRDKKSSSILTFKKVHMLDYEFDLDYTAENIVNELSEEPKYSNVEKERMELSDLDLIRISWIREELIPSRRNNSYCLALMNVCEQYYTFTLSMPDKKREDLMPVFEKILTSLQIKMTKATSR